MVQLLRPVILLLTFLAVTFAVPNAKRDIPHLQTDMMNLSKSCTNLADAVSGLSLLNLPGILAIIPDMGAVTSDLDTVSSDLEAAVPLSLDGCEDLLELLKGIEPTLIRSLQGIESNFEASLLFLVLQLVNVSEGLLSAYTSFANITTNGCPASILDQFNGINQNIIYQITNTIAALGV